MGEISAAGASLLARESAEIISRHMATTKKPIRDAETFEHQVKMHVRQARWQQHAGIQNNQGVAIGGEWMAVRHWPSPILGKRFDPSHHICFGVFVRPGFLPLRAQVSGLARHLVLDFPVQHSGT